MSFNLNEKCLLNFLCKTAQDKPEAKNNLVNLLEDFGIAIKNNKQNNQIYEIIEGYEKTS